MAHTHHARHTEIYLLNYSLLDFCKYSFVVLYKKSNSCICSDNVSPCHLTVCAINSQHPTAVAIKLPSIRTIASLLFLHLLNDISAFPLHKSRLSASKKSVLFSNLFILLFYTITQIQTIFVMRSVHNSNNVHFN